MIKKRIFISGVYLSLVIIVFNAQFVFSRTFSNPLSKSGGSVGISELVGRIISGVLGLSGVLAILFIILGGVNYIIGHSQGNQDRVAKGTKTLIYSIIGLIVAFGGYMIINMVLSASTSFMGG